MVYLKHIPNISLNNYDVFGPCSVCHIAKQQRIPFIRNFDKAENIFYLVHIDLWGPYAHYSIHGSPYFVSIVDDSTRAIWIYFIKHKSQTT